MEQESLKIAQFPQWGIEAIENVYGLSISSDSIENIGEIQSAIFKDPNLNLLIYFNHISFADAACATWLYRKYFDLNSDRRMVVPAAYQHMSIASDPVRGRLAKWGANLFDVEIAPIVQTYQAGKEYSDEETFSSYRRLFEQIRRTDRCDVSMSPEGHRSENWQLQKAETGIENISRTLKPVAIIPFAILPVHEERFLKRALRMGRDINSPDIGLNFYRDFLLRVGEPVFYREGKKPNADELMIRVAKLLPEHMRGVYTEQCEP